MEGADKWIGKMLLEGSTRLQTNWVENYAEAAGWDLTIRASARVLAIGLQPGVLWNMPDESSLAGCIGNPHSNFFPLTAFQLFST